MRSFCVAFTFAFIHIIKGQGLGGADPINCNESPGVNMCNQVGIHSQIICVSPTQFKLVGDDNKFSCPDGRVCADVPEICSISCEPVCPIPIPPGPGPIPPGPGGQFPAQCGVCGVDQKYTCINLTQYVECLNNNTSVHRTCPTITRFCKVDIADPTSIPCSVEQTSDCDNAAPLTHTYRKVGLFAVVGDTTCKQYIASYKLGSGFGQTQHTCLGESIFSASVQRCVSSPPYRCQG